MKRLLIAAAFILTPLIAHGQDFTYRRCIDSRGRFFFRKVPLIQIRPKIFADVRDFTRDFGNIGVLQNQSGLYGYNRSNVGSGGYGAGVLDALRNLDINERLAVMQRLQEHQQNATRELSLENTKAIAAALRIYEAEQKRQARAKTVEDAVRRALQGLDNPAAEPVPTVPPATPAPATPAAAPAGDVTRQLDRIWLTDKMKTTCLGCHGGAQTEAGQKYIFGSVLGGMRILDLSKLTAAHKDKIVESIASGKMPKGGKLDAAEKRRFYKVFSY